MKKLIFHVLMFQILLIASCETEKEYKSGQVFLEFFKNVYSVKIINKKTNNATNIVNSDSIYYLKRNVSNNTFLFLQGKKLLGEYLYEIDFEKTAKINKLTGNIFLKLFEGTLLKYSLKMHVSQKYKNYPTKWEVSNLMNYPYVIKNDTLAYEYIYLNDD